jgi:hypothetical protein
VTTTQRPRAKVSSATLPHHNGQVRLAQGRERKWSWTAIGVILVVGAMAGFGIWSSSLGHRQAVLAATHEIPAGATITASDLRRVDVGSGGGVATIPASQTERVIGQRARLTIPSGGLLTGDQLATGSLVPDGDAVTAVVLPPGAIPISGLRIGDRVGVVAASSQGQGGGTTSTSGDRTASADDQASLVATATVFGVDQPPSNGATPGTAVSLELPQDEAAEVATLAGRGNVRLILLPSIGASSTPNHARSTQKKGGTP